ncbi:MAG: hypothetical protein HFE30_00675 [Clostridiales bacterium]|nr:hypothetical protein [Clostridiales bacterium]
MEKFNIEAVTEHLKNVGVKTASALRDLLVMKDSEGSSLDGARARLEALFDRGTFSEIGTYVRKCSETEDKDGFESVICGWGAVNGQLVYAFSQDISRTSGAVSEAHAKKICELYKLALRNGAPVIGIFDSAGALISEGVRALAGYGRVMKAVNAASGVIPQIAIASGYTSGASAVICGMFDFVITSKKGSVSVNAPFIADGAGSEDKMAECGISAVTVEDDAAAIAAAKELLAYLPSNNAEGAPSEISSDRINREISLADYETGKDMKKLIASFADDGKFVEVYAGYAEEAVTGFVSLGGSSVGIIATNYAVNGGVLTAKAARKASRMVSLLDSFNIPILTIVDSIGLDKALSSEFSPYSSELAKLASAYAAASTPLITVIAGEAYGSVFTVMGSKSLGADIVLSLDSAKIASMNASSAVAFLWNDKIDGSTTREDLENLWNNSVATPVEAASSGEIDDIIENSELRQRIGAAVMMLSSKSSESSVKRHLVMPL